MNLDGKVTIVTGAAQGIGKAIALAFGKQGSKVVVADIDLQGAKEVAEKIQSWEADSIAIETNIANLGDIRRLVQKTLDQYSKIDILINNAGINFREPAEEVTEDHWDKIMDVNLKGAFFCSQEVGKIMIDQQGGKIINIASTESEGVIPELSVYCASKGGLLQITRALAVEWAPHHINVNAIGPAYVRTGLTEEWLKDEERYESIMARTPRRRLAEPEEIAEAALFLASPSADFITGEILYVDGGWRAL